MDLYDYKPAEAIRGFVAESEIRFTLEERQAESWRAAVARIEDADIDRSRVRGVILDRIWSALGADWESRIGPAPVMRSKWGVMLVEKSVPAARSAAAYGAGSTAAYAAAYAVAAAGSVDDYDYGANAARSAAAYAYAYPGEFFAWAVGTLSAVVEDA